jgi:hypothetical protein
MQRFCRNIDTKNFMSSQLVERFIQFREFSFEDSDLRGHLFKLGLTDDPICERCLEEDEGSATHILCDCEAIAYLRFRHLGQFFMEPSDYYDAPVNKLLHFIRGVG